MWNSQKNCQCPFTLLGTLDKVNQPAVSRCRKSSCFSCPSSCTGAPYFFFARFVGFSFRKHAVWVLTNFQYVQSDREGHMHAAAFFSCRYIYQFSKIWKQKMTVRQFRVIYLPQNAFLQFLGTKLYWRQKILQKELTMQQVPKRRRKEKNHAKRQKTLLTL